MEDFYRENIFGEIVNIGLSTRGRGDQPLSFEEKKSSFNIFSLTDAIGTRNKKQAWILYRTALLSGLSPEEIFWRVVWQIKSMLLVAKTGDVSETDMKKFAYYKIKSFLRNFKAEELEQISEDLVVGYYEARRGEGDIEILVEKTILNL